MREQWLPVLGYEGLYSVSDLGNVMSMNFAGTGMLRLLTPNKVARGGYYRVSLLKKDRKQKTMYVHVLVMQAFVGPRPEGMQINHKNFNKADNRLENLEYCTPLENKRHAVSFGMYAFGERNGGAKLTESQVREMKVFFANGETGAAVGIKFGISKSTACRIKKGSHWSYLHKEVQ